MARLDDDDILSPHYATSLSRYLRSEFSGFVVSFPLGYTGIFNQQDNHYYYLRGSSPNVVGKYQATPFG